MSAQWMHALESAVAITSQYAGLLSAEHTVLRLQVYVEGEEFNLVMAFPDSMYIWQVKKDVGQQAELTEEKLYEFDLLDYKLEVCVWMSGAAPFRVMVCSLLRTTKPWARQYLSTAHKCTFGAICDTALRAPWIPLA